MRLREQQDKIVALLKGTACLSDLTIIAEERQDLVTTVNTSLAKLGLCIIVQTLSAKVTKPNKPGPVYDDVKVSVVIYENVLINRSKSERTAMSVAEDVSAALHQKRLEKDGTGKMLLSEGVIPQQDSNLFVCAVDLTIN